MHEECGVVGAVVCVVGLALLVTGSVMAAPIPACAPGDDVISTVCYRQWKAQNRSETCWTCVNATGHAQPSIRVATRGYEAVLIAGGACVVAPVVALIVFACCACVPQTRTTKTEEECSDASISVTA